MILLVVLIYAASCYCRPLEIPTFLLGYNRSTALYRSLKSIDSLYKECNWKGDINILIDGPNSDNKEVVKIAAGYTWLHGRAHVRVQKHNIGIRGQRKLTSAENFEFWLVVEDDVEISSLACHFIEAALPMIAHRRDVIGISLTAPQWQIGINERGGWRRLDEVDSKFADKVLYFPAVSTWAQVFRNSTWTDWASFAKHRKMFSVHGSIYENWYQRRPDYVWSRDFQVFMHVSDLYNLHFVLPDNQVLAFSHREIGSNTSINKGPTGILAYDADLAQHVGLQEPRVFSGCFDPINDGDAIYLDYSGISYEMQRNHFCFMKMKRHTNLMITYGQHKHRKCISGLDYNGNTKLWTFDSLRREGLYFINDELECTAMECFYKRGLYPHI